MKSRWGVPSDNKFILLLLYADLTRSLTTNHQQLFSKNTGAPKLFDNLIFIHSVLELA